MSGGAMTCVAAAVLLVLAGAASDAAPQIIWASDPVLPGEVALLFGEGLADLASVSVRRLPDGNPGEPGGEAPVSPAAVTAEVLLKSSVSAYVLLPASLAPGVYQLSLRNAQGETVTRVVNQAQAEWWQGDLLDACTPGSLVRVFGRNLKPWQPGAEVAAVLAGPQGPRPVPVEFADKYEARVRLPVLEPGTYPLYVTNGSGGWSAPVQIRVEKERLTEGKPWPQTQYNVKDFGAVGRGGDETAAVQAALKKAKDEGGGVVYLPRGVYTISQTLVVPERTVLRGEGREAVWIQVPKALTLPAVITGSRAFAVEDLSIAAQMVGRMIVAPDWPALVRGAGGYTNSRGGPLDVRLHNLRLLHLRYAHRLRGTESGPPAEEKQGPTAVVLNGSRVQITNCDIVGAGMSLSLMGADHSLVSDNRLRAGRNGWYAISGAKQTVFENNRLEAADLEGSGGGLANHGHGGLDQVYVAHNRFGSFFGGEREALTFDTSFPYRGFWPVVAAEGNSVTVEGETWDWQAYESNCLALLVIAGKGLGQYRILADKQGNRLTVAEPWEVQPDASSTVAVVPDRRRVTVYANEFEDGSVFVQLWGPGAFFTIDGNHGRRCGGTWACGCQYQREAMGQTVFLSSWFNQWFDNVAEDPFIYEQGPSQYATVGLYLRSGPYAGPQGVWLLGNVFRRNTCEHGPIGIMYYKSYVGTRAYSEGQPPAPEYRVLPAADNLFERNLVKHGPLGYVIETECERTVLHANRAEGAERDVADAGQRTVVR